MEDIRDYVKRKETYLKYTYTLKWSKEDDEWVALCTEFPGLSWLHENPGEAMMGLHKMVVNVLEGMQKNNEPFPKPKEKNG